MVGLGVLLLIGAAALMVVIDYYFDSREPAEAEIELSDGSKKTGKVVEIKKYNFYPKGFIMENGAKLLLMLVVAFLVVPMITDDTKIKMQQALQKLDSLGKKIEPPTVSDEELGKMELTEERKKLKLPKMETKDGTWIVVTKTGKAFTVDDGENFTIGEALPPETKVMKKDPQGRYSEARALGK